MGSSLPLGRQKTLFSGTVEQDVFVGKTPTDAQVACSCYALREK